MITDAIVASTSILILWSLLILNFLDIGVDAHGRLMNPPARNSMWRTGFPTPANYNDNELYCGGYLVLWGKNKGKCGMCGDAHNVRHPRPHEAGGRYARGLIGRSYAVGQDMDIEIELTANHGGRFQLKLCPNNNPRKEATQECFDRFPLPIIGTNDMNYKIRSTRETKFIFKYKVRLPQNITCTQCVLQWTYITGNTWGMCDNGQEALGCGKSEMFRNCADISILRKNEVDKLPEKNPYSLYYRDPKKPTQVKQLVVRAQACTAKGMYKYVQGMTDWCQTNCLKYPPVCPTEYCTCPSECVAIGTLQGKDGAAAHCQAQCIVYPADRCPTKICVCR